MNSFTCATRLLPALQHHMHVRVTSGTLQPSPPATSQASRSSSLPYPTLIKTLTFVSSFFPHPYDPALLPGRSTALPTTMCCSALRPFFQSCSWIDRAAFFSFFYRKRFRLYFDGFWVWVVDRPAASICFGVSFDAWLFNNSPDTVLYVTSSSYCRLLAALYMHLKRACTYVSFSVVGVSSMVHTSWYIHAILSYLIFGTAIERH